ncbi:MAG TPA: ABC transporter permease [Chitinophagaceae bacterium]|jgi:predicted permease
MFKNHLKIAWRNLIKDRQFTFLNVLGLSAGLACALLIYFWVHDEMSVDKFFEKNDQIYQLMERRNASGQIGISDESSGMLGEVLKTQMPQVEYAAALAPPDWFQKFTLTNGDKNIKARGQYAGKDYFNIFSFRLIDGRKSDVLADKNSIVLSDELARKLFGTTENLIGKTVRFQHDHDFFISGVFEKPSSHSSQQFDFVLSFEYMKDIYPWVKTWNNTGPHNFVLLKKGTDINAFNKKIADVVTKNADDTTRKVFAMRFADNYLLNTFSHGSRTGGKMEYVRLFSIIAIFILLIACINFMNLSTAKAARRMKEVGIKKVIGARRKQLIFQFLAESIMLTAISMVIALAIVWALLPQFDQLTGKDMRLGYDPGLLLTLVGIILLTGLISGSYPAIYLSGFKPISILKGKIQSSLAEVFSRKGLIVFQFTLSALLIVSVLVVYQQIHFIQTTNPGYNKDNVIRFNSEGKIQSSEDAFVADLKKIPGVVNASYTWHNMIGRNYGDYGLSWEGKDPNESDYFEGFGGGYDFIETMGIQMVQGRSFSRTYGNEDSNIILNETAVKLMHLKDPVGKNVKYFDRNRQIIGVAKDFHYESLHEAVKPCFIVMEGQGNIWDKIMVRIKGDDQGQTISAIQGLYDSYNPGFPFDYNFLDESYQKQYLTESRVGILSKYFAALAILISCLGLFGLAAFTAQKRQKEIGIRKVVGASANNIAIMLSKDFLRLTIIAVLIAFPLAWWAMNRWLQSFAYRIHISASVFVFAGFCVIFITLLTVSFQAIKAAIANPVKSLRME